ncbi:MAG: FAD-dependent thymidylate synthase [Candidatus Cloacimonadia bacterium]
MRVLLAGFNIDFEQIKEFESHLESSRDISSVQEKFDKIQFTPETISAAYARISRSKKSAPELRFQAREEIEKARKSNQNIVFEMGHSSIAEHAVFNFDLIGISRYLVEFIERTRLASFTEKSQRYVTLEDDFVIPNEIRDDRRIANEFSKVIRNNNAVYHQLNEALLDYYRSLVQSKGQDNPSKKEYEDKAKEDARYVLPLATETQLGMTINARSLERLLKRLYALNLEEATEIANKLYNEAKAIAPSLIRYVQPTDYDCKLYETSQSATEVSKVAPPCKLLSYTDCPDDIILTALLFRRTGKDWENLYKEVAMMSSDQKKDAILQALKGIESYDSMPREFEMVDFTFQLKMSASCFAQLKRHRMSSIIATDYDPVYGYVLPISIKKAGQEREFGKAMQSSEELYQILERVYPRVKNYILTNAHQRYVLMKLNLRELAHFSRLRQDKHAQWEIRSIAHDMVEQCKNVAPLTTLLVCGKDKFQETYQQIFPH